MSPKEQSKAYLNILISSIQKKEQCLQEILEYSNQQGEILAQQDPDLEALDALVLKKAPLIEEINRLDEGFSTLFQRVEQTVKQDSKAVQLEINKLQNLIRSVTDLSTRIQAKEQNNRLKMEMALASKKEAIRDFQLQSKTTDSYHKSQYGYAQGEAYFIDKKK